MSITAGAGAKPHAAGGDPSSSAQLPAPDNYLSLPGPRHCHPCTSYILNKGAVQWDKGAAW